MSSKNKHVIFVRNPEEEPIWGGLEKLMLEWFERIDYTQCRATLAVSRNWVQIFKEKLNEKNVPLEVMELPFELNERRFLKRFSNLFFFLKNLKPSTIVFIQGWLFNFDLAYVLAGFLV